MSRKSILSLNSTIHKSLISGLFVVCSTGFYSPPVIEIEAYKYCQLSIKSLAAESRRFGDEK